MKPISIIIAALSALVWKLETIRCRWQTERDHQKAELITSNKLTPLRCPACFAEYGAPADWPKTICPACKRKFLVRPAIDTGRVSE